MKPYKPFTDRFDRILARCPECHGLWKTDEAWQSVRRAVRQDAFMEASRMAREMGAEEVAKRMRDPRNFD